MYQLMLTFTYLSSWLILPPLAFHILLHATVSAMERLWVKGVFSLYLIIHGLRKGPGKFLAVILESPGFFSSERVGTLIFTKILLSIVVCSSFFNSPSCPAASPSHFSLVVLPLHLHSPTLFAIFLCFVCFVLCIYICTCLYFHFILDIILHLIFIVFFIVQLCVCHFHH